MAEENGREGNVSGFLPLGVGGRGQGSVMSSLGFEDTWQGPRLRPRLGTQTRHLHLASGFASLASLSFLSPSPISAAPALFAYTEGRAQASNQIKLVQWPGWRALQGEERAVLRQPGWRSPQDGAHNKPHMESPEPAA